MFSALRAGEVKSGRTIHLTMSELSDFFLNGSKPTKKETKQFYEKCNNNESMNFYQIDISERNLSQSEYITRLYYRRRQGWGKSIIKEAVNE